MLHRSQPLFSFQASRGYLKLQPEYLAAVDTNDPNTLFRFLQQHPFHVEALFQGCLYYLLQSNYEQAGVLLERLLYVFQLSFHHQFSVLSPDARLAMRGSLYDRLFYEALFMHVDILGRKGCSRTALEVAKLLLSLSPQEDPLGSLFQVEYFCIRCKKVRRRQYDYFTRLISDFGGEVHGEGTLLWMPDYLYSLALVKAVAGPDSEHPAPVSLQTLQSLLPLSSWQDLVTASQDVLLYLAVSLFPLVAVHLLRKLAKAFPAETPQEDFGIGNVAHIAEVYTERCGDLWKSEALSSWLQASYVFSAQQPAGAVPWRSRISLPFSLDRYASLDKKRFSETVHTAVPEELLAAGVQQRPARPRGNLNRFMHPLLLYFALLLPWNSVDLPDE